MQQVTLDLLVAGISLPIFMPAVLINQDWYTDAVWIKDANLMTAVNGGSEELWIVWCIGNTPQYLAGAFHQYVHMIEMAGNGRLIIELEQIEEINRKIAAGGAQSPPTRPVKVHVVKPRYPLPLDPDFFLGKITASTLINMGYSDTYRYIEREMKPEGVPLTWEATQMKIPGVVITFSRTMKWSRDSGSTGWCRTCAGSRLQFSVCSSLDVSNRRPRRFSCRRHECRGDYRRPCSPCARRRQAFDRGFCPA